jgi:hypothetical protein
MEQSLGYLQACTMNLTNILKTLDWLLFSQEAKIFDFQSRSLYKQKEDKD